METKIQENFIRNRHSGPDIHLLTHLFFSDNIPPPLLPNRYHMLHPLDHQLNPRPIDLLVRFKAPKKTPWLRSQHNYGGMWLHAIPITQCQPSTTTWSFRSNKKFNNNSDYESRIFNCQQIKIKNRTRHSPASSNTAVEETALLLAMTTSITAEKKVSCTLEWAAAALFASASAQQ